MGLVRVRITARFIVEINFTVRFKVMLKLSLMVRLKLGFVTRGN